MIHVIAGECGSTAQPDRAGTHLRAEPAWALSAASPAWALRPVARIQPECWVPALPSFQPQL